MTYAYTGRGQLAAVTDWNAKQTGYSYDPAGRLTAVASLNGVAGSLGYDTADRLTSLAYTNGSTSLESIGYTLDAAGNRTQLADSTGTTTFGYDALDRLTSASYPNNDAVSYGYDPVGNRTSRTVNGTTTTSTFDAADRMTAAGGTTYSYDSSGNELTKTAGGVTTTYAYDLLNRLTGISGPVSASYASNGDGLRVGKTVGGTTTTYAWDPTGLGTVLSDGTGEYVWGQGLVSQVTASATTYAHSDGLGSLRLLTDASGAVAGRQSFDAYGASRSQSGVQLPFGFTGEQQDGESGLVYLRARYMDPGSGRFLSKDPLGLGGGSTDLYAYVSERPTAATDPSGELCFLGFSIDGFLGAGCTSTVTGTATAAPSPTPTPRPGEPGGPDWPVPEFPTATPTATPCPTPTPSASGPGRWVPVNRFMSPEARAYQEYVTGHTSDEEYLINGVMVEGYDPARNVLLDAKGPRYAYLLQRNFGEGILEGMVKEAQQQVDAGRSAGLTVEWHVKEQAAYDIISRRFAAEKLSVTVRYDPGP